MSQWTPGEYALLMFLTGKSGSFYDKLFKAIAKADKMNREKLRIGFPEEVAAYVGWSEGDLADRARTAGFNV